jgi:hypothetical protein
MSVETVFFHLIVTPTDVSVCRQLSNESLCMDDVECFRTDFYLPQSLVLRMIEVERRFLVFAPQLTLFSGQPPTGEKGLPLRFFPDGSHLDLILDEEPEDTAYEEKQEYGRFWFHDMSFR